MKKETNRQKKFNRMIQREMSEIFQHEFRLPAGIMLTVTAVTCSPDLQYAKAYFSIFPDAKGPETLAVIEERKWEVRKLLASRVRKVVRVVPELSFYEDDSMKVAEEMDALFESLKADTEEE